MSNCVFNPLLKISFLFSVLLFCACEYDSDNMNYHELPRPENNLSVTYNLADVPEGGMIYIYSPTRLTYTLNISSGTILRKEFYLNNQRITDVNGEIFLSPDILYNNTANVLSLKIEVGSGTGSLAEILGGEKSEFEFDYLVKYVNPDIRLDIKQRVSRENHLELYWEKPQIEGVEIENYRIYYYDNFEELLVKEITDPDVTSYVDKDYVYGAKTYRIVVTYNSNEITPKEDFYTVKYSEFSEGMFTYNSSEQFKLKIKWKNPNAFVCKYVLCWKGEEIYMNEGVSEASVPRPTYPMTGAQYYELYILPVDGNFSDYTKYPKVISYFSGTVSGRGK